MDHAVLDPYCHNLGAIFPVRTTCSVSKSKSKSKNSISRPKAMEKPNKERKIGNKSQAVQDTHMEARLGQHPSRMWWLPSLYVIIFFPYRTFLYIFFLFLHNPS